MDSLVDRKSLFASLLGAHQTQLFGYIYSLVRDLDHADDLFQQTSLVLWDKFDQYDADKSFIAWACGFARYEVLNFLRSRSRQRLVFSDELARMLIDAHEDLARRESEATRLDALARCMGKLRDRDRQLLDACYGRRERIRAVAEDWGRSTQSIHNTLRRIRRTLFECVSRSLGREGAL